MHPKDLLNELDRLTLDKVAQQHPGAAIRVYRGFFDGTDAKPFGYVPHDWSGETISYDFRLVPPK